MTTHTYQISTYSTFSIVQMWCIGIEYENKTVSTLLYIKKMQKIQYTLTSAKTSSEWEMTVFTSSSAAAASNIRRA